MSDLVERLRERATSYRTGGPSSEHTAVMLEEAADEIERLSEANTQVWADNERLRAALRDYSCTCANEFDGCKARYDMMVCCGWIARAALEERT